MTHSGNALSCDAIGIGWRPELAADLLATPECVDLLEVVAENCQAHPTAWREACALAERFAIVPHGVKLSLGSAAGIDPTRARRLGDLARAVGAACVSEHVAMTQAGGCDVGHLTPVPFTREAVRVLVTNVTRARRELPEIPLLLENIAWTLRWPEDEMGEGEFHAEVAAATGCDLLLDVANLYANARNSGRDPLALLAEYPLDRVAMIHAAGGVWEHGFYVDTHADPLPAEVLGLVEAVFTRVGPRPVILERDAAFPPFDVLRGELDALRGLARGAERRPRLPPSGASLPGVEGRPTGVAPLSAAPPARSLASRQTDLAMRLTDAEAPDSGPFEPAALRRTRAILSRKRVDEAMPLLARLGRVADSLRTRALAALDGTQRATSHAAVHDARRIAGALADDPLWAGPARLDALELRARFGGDGALRLAPHASRAALGDGTVAWAFKGPGRGAGVRLLQTGGGR